MPGANIGKIIVFDLDKTLTYKDTLMGFFFFVSKKNLSFVLKLCKYFVMIAKKKITLSLFLN